MGLAFGKCPQHLLSGGVRLLDSLNTNNTATATTARIQKASSSNDIEILSSKTTSSDADDVRRQQKHDDDLSQCCCWQVPLFVAEQEFVKALMDIGQRMKGLQTKQQKGILISFLFYNQL